MPEVLAESYTRVEGDARAVEAGRAGGGDAQLEEVVDVEQHVAVARVLLHGARVALGVHEAERRGPRGYGDAALVMRERRDVVEHDRAGGQRRLGHGRLARVDRDGDRAAALAQSLYHRQDAVELLLERHGFGPGARRLAADVEDVGPRLGQREAVRDGVRGAGEEAAVGEAVRGDVDHPHDARPAEVEAGERRARPGHGLEHLGLLRVEHLRRVDRQNLGRLAPAQDLDLREAEQAAGQRPGIGPGRRAG